MSCSPDGDWKGHQHMVGFQDRQLHPYGYTNTHTCTHAYTHTYTHTHTRIHTRAYTHAHAYTQHTQRNTIHVTDFTAHTDRHKHTCTHTHTHSHTRAVHVHVCGISLIHNSPVLMLPCLDHLIVDTFFPFPITETYIT